MTNIWNQNIKSCDTTSICKRALVGDADALDKDESSYLLKYLVSFLVPNLREWAALKQAKGRERE